MLLVEPNHSKQIWQCLDFFFLYCSIIECKNLSVSSIVRERNMVKKLRLTQENPWVSKRLKILVFWPAKFAADHNARYFRIIHNISWYININTLYITTYEWPTDFVWYFNNTSLPTGSQKVGGRYFQRGKLKNIRCFLSGKLCLNSKQGTSQVS